MYFYGIVFIAFDTVYPRIIRLQNNTNRRLLRSKKLYREILRYYVALIERDLEHATEYDEYHIKYLYFPNGGYLTFDTCEPEDNDIYPNEEENVYDYRGDEYYITLTKQKVK